MKAPKFAFATLGLVTAASFVWLAVVSPHGAVAAAESQVPDKTVSISGVVQDRHGGSIEAASLQFSHGDVLTAVETDRQGNYTVRLEPGTYLVQVKANGFQTISSRRVEVHAVSRVVVDFTMFVFDMDGDAEVVGSYPPDIPPTPFATELSDPSPAENQSSAYPLRYASIKTVQAWIPMKDEVRLAVNLYMPDGPLSTAHPGEKFPAILEYLPYRKDDWTLARDWDLNSYFVRRGYVTARVDIRGTGASEGVPPDREYSDQEQQDGLEVIAWLAKQPWSNGNVGMTGISWGGFNSIQLARLHPPALKAIIAMCATEELFHDDIHYIDNLMHLDEFELGMDLQLGLTRAPDFPTREKSLAARI